MVEQGLRKGCPLSPWLGSERSYGGISRRSGAGQLPHSNLSVYRRHSDDCPDRRRPTVSWNVGRFHEAVKRHGLMINWRKTNTMVFSREPPEWNIEVGDVQLEQAGETVYLGARLSENGRMESELERRIDRAATVVGALRRTVFENRELSSEAKMTVYNAMIAPTLVYGC